jgi:hypothetical protein
MSGDMAFSMRRNGRQSARVFNKTAADHFSDPHIFAPSHELWKVWKQTEAEVIAPHDYGLVAIDFDRKWVGEINSYTGLDVRQVDFRGFNGLPLTHKAELAKLYKADRLNGILETCDRLVCPPGNSFGAWFKSLERWMRDNQTAHATISVGLPQGWSLEHFNGDADGWRGLAVAMIERDWTFNAPDRSAWQKYLKLKELPTGLLDEAIATVEATSLSDRTAPSAKTHRQAPRL